MIFDNDYQFGHNTFIAETAVDVEAGSAGASLLTVFLPRTAQIVEVGLFLAVATTAADITTKGVVTFEKVSAAGVATSLADVTVEDADAAIGVMYSSGSLNTYKAVRTTKPSYPQVAGRDGEYINIKVKTQGVCSSGEQKVKPYIIYNVVPYDYSYDV